MPRDTSRLEDTPHNTPPADLVAALIEALKTFGDGPPVVLGPKAQKAIENYAAVSTRLSRHLTLPTAVAHPFNVKT
jgi:hypothetical protein